MHAHVGIQEEKNAALGYFRADVPRRCRSLPAWRCENSDAADRRSLDSTTARTVVQHDDFQRGHYQALDSVQAFVQIVSGVISRNHNRNLREHALAPVNLYFLSD